eukprot:Plantae.Rhodophyta-Rhodochaete_pulchella.ctg36197.p1 GENE.Plantae.Rhodophyta-Rhodochaete_pulchella.ctg36197~~Plantae.Rhodophyta-Rhodochaete_pulchella.ctg36197.p1  ORF type:complete len:511 (+),score=63.60 Plantae.Rhodophyta-Rhodochaete_pulchella.ctg36197:280-1812(+)
MISTGMGADMRRLYILIVILVCVLAILVAVAFPKLWYRRFPGPPITDPFLGHLNLFRVPGKAPMVFRRLQAQCGKTFQVFYATNRMVIVTHPDDIQYILATCKMAKSHIFNTNFGLIGDSRSHGLLTMAENIHPQHRRPISQLIYGAQTMQRLHDSMVEEVTTFLQRLDRVCASSGEYIDFDKEVIRMTLSVILYVAFAYKDPDLQRDPNHPLLPAMSNILKEIYIRVSMHPFGSWFGNTKKLNAARDVIRSYCARIVESRREERAGNEIPQRDMLDLFMELSDGNDSYTISQLVTFMIAGHDTTSHTLSFVVYELCRHPHVLDRLLDEIERVLGSDKMLPDYEDVKKFEYAHQIWKETLRLHPVAATGTMRTTGKRSVTLPATGLRIGPNTTIAIPIYVVHRDPDVYENPDDFIPERWDSKSPSYKPIHPFAFQGFSAGVRNCVGQYFATHEAIVTIVALYRRFKVELACPVEEIEEFHATTMKPRVRRREGQPKRATVGLPIKLIRRA